MIDDELPIDDPDEIAVESEFKNKTAEVTAAPELKEESTTKHKKTNKHVDAVSSVTQPAANNSTSSVATTLSHPVVEQPQSQKTSPLPHSPSSQQPNAAAAPSTSSPDIDRLRSIAKSNGLSTSMDRIGRNGVESLTFDIEVMDEDDDGHRSSHVERGVAASSEAELRELYAMSGQKVRILRKYAPQSHSSSKPTAPQQPQSNTPAMQSTANAPECIPQPAAEIKTPEPPKYFNVSGVECKLENGKVYQRQWVRLAGADAESFRLVNDANNKIVPIDGKHIEQKKWVLIQENTDETA